MKLGSGETGRDRDRYDEGLERSRSYNYHPNTNARKTVAGTVRPSQTIYIRDPELQKLGARSNFSGSRRPTIKPSSPNSQNMLRTQSGNATLSRVSSQNGKFRNTIAAAHPNSASIRRKREKELLEGTEKTKLLSGRTPSKRVKGHSSHAASKKVSFLNLGSRRTKHVSSHYHHGHHGHSRMSTIDPEKARLEQELAKIDQSQKITIFCSLCMCCFFTVIVLTIIIYFVVVDEKGLNKFSGSSSSNFQSQLKHEESHANHRVNEVQIMSEEREYIQPLQLVWILGFASVLTVIAAYLWRIHERLKTTKLADLKDTDRRAMRMIAIEDKSKSGALANLDNR